MADFLNRLVARTLGVAPVARPIIPAMFGPGLTFEAPNPVIEFVRENCGEPVKSSVAATTKKETLPDPDRSLGPYLATLPGPEVSLGPLSAHPEAVLRNAARSPLEAERSLDASKQTSPLTKLTTNTRTEPVPSSISGSRKDVASEPTMVDGIARVTPTVRWTIPQMTVQKKLRLPEDVRSQTPTEAPQERPKVVPVLSAYENRSQILGRGLSVPQGQTPRGPVVRVTIGRVDVRAEFSSRSTSQATAETTRPSMLSLGEYLKQRKEGKR
jgi:hypothetical protein